MYNVRIQNTYQYNQITVTNTSCHLVYGCGECVFDYAILPIINGGVIIDVLSIHHLPKFQ